MPAAKTMTRSLRHEPIVVLPYVPRMGSMSTKLASRLLLLAALAMSSGCIATTHMSPEPGPRLWDQIHWAKSFEDACKEARAEKKPILTIVSAGARDGFC